MQDPDMQTFYNSWWFILVIATVLDTRQCFGMAQSPVCSRYGNLPPRPIAVTVPSLTTRGVTVTVTLSPGYYEALHVYVYSGQGVVSSGSVNFGGQRFNTQTSQTYIVSLSSLLTLGMNYTIKALIRSGAACTYLPTNPASAIARQAQAPTLTSATEVSGGIRAAWTPGPGNLDSISLSANVNVPTLTSATEVSGGIKVTWTPSSGQPDRIIVSLQPPTGAAVTLLLQASGGNQQQSVTVPAPQLVKGQTYTVSLIAEYGDVQHRGSLSRTVTLSPSVPTLNSATVVSNGIQVRWTPGPGQLDKIIVTLQPPAGAAVTHQVQASGGNQQQSVTVPASKLVKDQTYTVSLVAESRGVQSSSSSSQLVTLSPVTTTTTQAPPPTIRQIVGPPPVNVSVLSATSRSVLLTWQRDNNVNSYRLLVSQDQRCVQDVYFSTQVPFPTSSCARVKTEALDVSAVDVTYNITGLLPYRGYQIALYVTFVAGSEPSRLNVMTDAEVPSEVPVTQITVGGDKNVSVCWSRPEPFPGPTNYTLTLVDLGQDPRPDRQLVTQDMNNLCGQFTDLEKYWPYRIRLRASTKAGDGPTSESQEFRTPEAVPGHVTNLEFIASGNSFISVDVTWGPPKPRDRNANITGFILKYRNKVSDNVTSFNIPWSQSDNEVYSKEVQVEPGETYNFSLVAVSKFFVGEVLYAEYLAARGREPHSPSLTAVIAGVSCGVVVLILIVTITLYCLLSRRTTNRDRKQTEESYSNTLPMSQYESTQNTVNKSEEGHYEDMGNIVIPVSHIMTSNIKLSNGKHEVVKGTLELENGNLQHVAVRIIKGNRAFERCQEEVSIMRSIGVNPNIVSFLGYALKAGNSVLMLSGFEDNGDLHTFLREKRLAGANSGWTEANLLKFTEDVARGMAHLAKLNILHGDLRACNILVAKDLTAKISGLQQARPVGENDKAVTKKNFPLQGWAPIETLEHKIYTVHSEIWSFGVLMWEVMTYGETPYDGMKSADIKNLLRKQCRLTCPKSCQLPLYSVMLECWKEDPEERPSFHDLSHKVAAMITDVQHYMNIGIYETVDDIRREPDY